MKINAYEYIKNNYPNLTVSKLSDNAKVIRVSTKKSSILLDTSTLDLFDLQIILKNIL